MAVGVVTTVFPGKDGVVRAAEVRTVKGSVVKRPIQKLYNLEINDRVCDLAQRTGQDLDGPPDVQLADTEVDLHESGESNIATASDSEYDAGDRPPAVTHTRTRVVRKPNKLNL